MTAVTDGAVVGAHNRSMQTGWTQRRWILALAAAAMAATAPKAVRAEAPVGESVAKTVCGFIGRPYVWGGDSPDGFDCSGLVAYVYRRHGIDLPHSAAALYNLGTPVAYDDLQPGDLIFQANTYKPGISHVGVYIGGGQMVHAQNSRVGVVLAAVPRFGASHPGARRIVAGRARWSPAPSSVGVEGALEIEGTVAQVLPTEGVATVNVTRVVDAAGRQSVLSPARPKLLVLTGPVPGAGLLSVGARIAAAGTDTGPGTPLKVRRIARRGELARPVETPAADTPEPPVVVPDEAPEPAPTPAPTPRRPVAAPRTRVLADFERGLDGWSVAGNAFGSQPTAAFYGDGRFSGWSGGGYLSSAHAPFAGAPVDAGRGRAVSPAFEITADTIQFRIAGGRHDGECCVNLVVDGQIVRTATGDNTDVLKAASWDVSELRGKSATLEVVDSRSVGQRGYILIDRIELADR